MIKYNDFVNWRGRGHPYGSNVQKVLVYVLPHVNEYLRDTPNGSISFKTTILVLVGMLLLAKNPYHISNTLKLLEKHLTPADMELIRANASFVAKMR